MKPPLLARALLAALAGETEAASIAGDLQEEFAQIADLRGGLEANRWYWRQVIRSAPDLLLLQVRSGEMARMLAGNVLAAMLPILLLDRLWTFVYSQIPLKDGIERGPLFLAINVLCACCCISALPVHRAAMGALAAAASTAFALWASTGSTPPAYAITTLLAVPACVLLRRKLS